jgi:Phosphotransferase enzyme family
MRPGHGPDSVGPVDGGDEAEVPMRVWGSGDQPPRAARRIDVVFREAGPWSPAVLALLRHLEREGFAGAPRVVGSGFAEDGRETVSYIPGASPHPYGWTEDAAAGVGTLLRDLHAAAASFAPAAGACWRPWFGRDLPGSRPVIGHCDAGPWNVIARGGRPVALVDFEFAGPVDAVWELAQATWLNAQLHDDDVAERHGLPGLAERARQARMILDGYGLPGRDREDFVDKMITFAVHSARAEAVEFGVTPETRTGVTSTGYPLTWAITWRVRSASWMLTHRSRLQREIG